MKAVNNPVVNSRPVLETLEGRRLLSATVVDDFLLGPIGADGDEGFANQRLDADAEGNLVYTWRSPNASIGGYDIYAQTFSSDGTPDGTDPIYVAHAAAEHDRAAQVPQVAMGADGTFVVAWAENEGNSYGAYAKLFSPAGSSKEVQVYGGKGKWGSVGSPSPAVDDDGDFVVAFHVSSNGMNTDIYAQRFNSAGRKLGKAIAVADSRDSEAWPHAAMDANGNFVVAWRGYDDDQGVFARRFSADGTALGDGFNVNTTTAGWQIPNDVAMSADGRFVITWRSDDQDGIGVFAQLYNAAGDRVGGEFQVNDTWEGNQLKSHAGFGDDGGFVIAWQSSNLKLVGNSITGDAAVFAKRYAAGGAEIGPEFKASVWDESLSFSYAGAPQLAMQPGGFVAGWRGMTEHRPDPDDSSTWYVERSEELHATKLVTAAPATAVSTDLSSSLFSDTLLAPSDETADDELVAMLA